MEAVYEACERLGLVIFLHPHYGIGGGGGAYGEEQGAAATRDYGHVLPLALGFPFETSLAVARLLLSGYLDRFPRLTFLLAHAGGTLPFLAGRLDSCVAHDPAVATRLQHTPSEYLRRNFYFDGVIYHRPGLEALLQFLGPDYADRVVWGTDHPFFPPLPPARKEVDLWPSTMKNYQILLEGDGEGEGEKREKEWEAIVRGNASKLLDIPSFA
jgi:predicted TIM-barrel fold metal-dependent hydrolase